MGGNSKQDYRVLTWLHLSRDFKGIQAAFQAEGLAGGGPKMEAFLVHPRKAGWRD